MGDYLIEMFNTVDIRVAEQVCKNIGYELIIEDGKVVACNLVNEKEEK